MDYWGGGGGGAKGYVGPPLTLLGGGAWPPWPPSSYAYGYFSSKTIPKNLVPSRSLRLFRKGNACVKAKFHRTERRLIESIMGLRPRLGNLRLVFRLFSLMRGLPSIRLK